MRRRAVLGWIVGVALAVGAVPAFAGIVPETLQDGTKIEIDGDKIYVIRAGDGSVKPGATAAKKPQRVPAADGMLKLKSGKTIEVKNGKLVTAPAPQK